MHCCCRLLEPVVENYLYARELYRGDGLVRGRMRADLKIKMEAQSLPDKKSLMMRFREMK